jgi:hypothetical protein
MLELSKRSLGLDRRTRRIRAATAGACLKLLTPNFYQVVKDRIERIDGNEFPRPSTSLIHGIFGERPLTCVEIGTGFGKNALNILNELSIERLYCVDPFIPYFDGANQLQMQYINRQEETLKTLSEHDNVTFIRKCSSDASKDLPKNVNFVYVDGNHNYEYVLADLHNYYPLVCEKGILAGHDVDYPDVYKAVVDFCTVNKLTPIIRSPDWIILK